MSTSPPSRRGGKPKVVTDEVRAAELRTELQRADAEIREASARRLRLAVEAYDVGMTLIAVGEAAGVSHVAVANWVKAARNGDPDID